MAARSRGNRSVLTSSGVSGSIDNRAPWAGANRALTALASFTSLRRWSPRRLTSTGCRLPSAQRASSNSTLTIWLGSKPWAAARASMLLWPGVSNSLQGTAARGTASAARDTARSWLGPVHLAVALLQAGLIGMEGIAILHDEFAATHQSEAGPNLVPEFGLNLIKIYR